MLSKNKGCQNYNGCQRWRGYRHRISSTFHCRYPEANHASVDKKEDIFADYSFTEFSLGLYYYSDLQLWLELYFGREKWLGALGAEPNWSHGAIHREQ